MHVEEHLLFSMNTSASPGRDKAKLNCSSKGMSKTGESQNASFFLCQDSEYIMNLLSNFDLSILGW